MKKKQPAMNQTVECLTILPKVFLFNTSDQNDCFALKQRKDSFPDFKEAKMRGIDQRSLEHDIIILTNSRGFEGNKSKYQLIHYLTLMRKKTTGPITPLYS